jgi:aminocarboxymuconate-semialdehyde decarboxylase
MTNPPGPRPTTVDVHAHLMPDAAFDGVPAPLEAVTNDAGERAVRSPDRPELGRGAPADLRSLSDHRARQAARGVDVSLVGPWVDQVKAPLDPGVQAAWCRAINAGLAAACAGQGHSRWLAALPDLDGALAAEVLAEAAHLPIVVHPGEYHVPERLRDFFLVNLVGNPFETTLAAASLLARGVPDRFAELRLVLVHGGGFLPYQFGRLDAGFDRWPGLRGVATSSPRDHLAWFAYDTVLFDDAPTRYLLDLVGPERVLAGSDCPFTMADHRPFEAPGGLGLGPAETEAVLGGNARALFRLDDL